MVPSSCEVALSEGLGLFFFPFCTDFLSTAEVDFLETGFLETVLEAAFGIKGE